MAELMGMDLLLIEDIVIICILGSNNKFHLNMKVDMLKKDNMKHLVWMVHQYYGVFINKMHDYIIGVQG